ncbi:MAG: homoserine O-succinyltransferase [Pseudomonadota bacterium]|nr:homoserine O-succinyltransferase [Pseudomonadota bacterium]
MLRTDRQSAECRPTASAKGMTPLQLTLAQSPNPRPTVLRDFEVRLDLDFAVSTRATLCGREGAPVVVVLGGISANRFVARCDDGRPGWWASLVSEGSGVDLDHFQVLGLDFAADDTGRTAPSSADQAGVICGALDAVGAAKAHAIVGASYGGMVALAAAEHHPERVDRVVAVSAGACPHPFATALRELQRRVVDLGLRNGDPDEALSIARGIAMLSYRTAEEFDQRFSGGIPGHDCLGTSGAGEYLRARGEQFRSVMSPERFLSLSASIDRHFVNPERIAAPTLIIGAETDQLVPPGQLQALHARLAGPSHLHLLPCLYGHDMFLKEPETLAALVKPFLEEDL